MNKLFIGFVIFLSALILFGNSLLSDVGYVLINFKGYSIETSVLVLCVVLIATVFLLQLLFSTIKKTAGIKGSIQHWRAKKVYNRSVKLMSTGFVSRLQGDLQKAEASLQQSAQCEDHTLISMIALTETAHQAGDFKKRDQLLNQLAKLKPMQHHSTIDFIRADYFLASEEWSKAENILSFLQKRYPKHPKLLHGLAEIYTQKSEWQNLIHLLPSIKKCKYPLNPNYNELKKLAFKNSLSELITQSNHISKDQIEKQEKAILNIWSLLPEDLISNIDYVTEQCTEMNNNQLAGAAKLLLEKLIKSKPEPKLIQTYGYLSSDPDKLMHFLEKGIGKKVTCAEYYLALGHLHYRKSNLEEAKKLLERSLRLRISKEALTELANTTYQLGEFETSSKNFKKSHALLA